ncbi:MAG: 5-formyltetrahydrofolate cyclo-ligase [Methanocorpusculum sp.]|nr:5-formyltetrahydrofolate cyclo-ligase [Methanocorpusculum sp.]
MPDKSELRIQLKAKREEIPLGARREKSYHITKHLEKLLDDYKVVLAYVAKEPEVETMVIINHLLENGKKVIVPIIQKETKTLRFSYLESIAELEPGTFKVPEPHTYEKPADPNTIEVAILPVVGFDKHGNRLGYGAGYYDRFLEKFPNLLKIGIAFACQEADLIPVEPFDAKMDYVVTEGGVIICDS